MKRKLTFYAAFFFLSMLFMRLSGVLAKIILARSITPYEYGIVTLVVISLPAFFQLFATFSLYDILSHSKYGRKYFGFTLIITVVAVSLILLLSFIFHEALFSFVNLPLDSWEIIFFALVLTTFPVCIIPDFMGLYRGLRKYSSSTKISLIPSVLRLAFIAAAVLVFDIRDFYTILLIFAAPPLCTLLFYIIKEFRTIVSYLKTITIPSKDVVSFGTSLYIVGIFLSSNYIIIKIVVSHLLGIVWQGYFDVSLTLVSVLTFFSGTLYFITVPETTNDKDIASTMKKPGGLEDITKTLFSYLIFCVIILHFYSVPLVSLLFSESYVISATYTNIIAIGYIFLFIQGFIAYMKITQSNSIKEQKPLVFVTLISLLLLPFFTYLMIEMLGFLGAYVSMTVFSIIYTIATIIVTKNLSDIVFIFHRVGGIILSVSIVFLFLYLTNLPLLYGLASSILLYSFILFSTGYTNKKIITDFFKRES